MRMQDVLAIGKASEGNQIVINGYSANTIKLVGTSVFASVNPGTITSSITFQPAKPGIVALLVYADNYRQKGCGAPNVGFIFWIREKEGRFYVDEESLGQTASGRLGAISSYSCLEVRAEGRMFLNRNPASYEEYTDFRIADSNVLCQFLAGDITLEELEANASELEEDKAAAEKLPLVEAELKGKLENIERLVEDFRTYREKQHALSKELWEVSRSPFGYLRKSLLEFLKKNYPDSAPMGIIIE
jgi:hypothetical protein